MSKNRRAPTPEQLEVVRLSGGPARVLAGAGSGKTYTMTELVRSRVDDHLRGYGGTPPERILALTFTVKAAEEMHRRLLETLGERALKLDVSNFHSYAFSLVRENAATLGLEPEAPVLRRGRAWLMVLEELGADDLTLRRLDLSDPASAADRALKLLSGTKNRDSRRVPSLPGRPRSRPSPGRQSLRPDLQPTSRKPSVLRRRRSRSGSAFGWTLRRWSRKR